VGTVMSHSSRYCSVILFEAQRLVAAGLSVIPILPDGSKKPAVAWKSYQTRLPTKAELVQWFHDETRGMAAIGGAVSGCLEILDFDAQELFDPWSIMVETLCPGLLMRLSLSETPSKGRHVFYRCQSIAGNQKLAQRYGLDGTPETLVETRGEGGYAIVPPPHPPATPQSVPTSSCMVISPGFLK
jgi:putative DNA primase/helicase